MKLWYLAPRDDLPDDSSNPWYPRYDVAYAFVVRAETEEEARKYAVQSSGDEIPGRHKRFDENGNLIIDEGYDKAWTSPEYSTCEELTAEGEPGVVIRDFRAG